MSFVTSSRREIPLRSEMRTRSGSSPAVVARLRTPEKHAPGSRALEPQSAPSRLTAPRGLGRRRGGNLAMSWQRQGREGAASAKNEGAEAVRGGEAQRRWDAHVMPAGWNGETAGVWLFGTVLSASEDRGRGGAGDSCSVTTSSNELTRDPTTPCPRRGWAAAASTATQRDRAISREIESAADSTRPGGSKAAATQDRKS